VVLLGWVQAAAGQQKHNMHMCKSACDVKISWAALLAWRGIRAGTYMHVLPENIWLLQLAKHGSLRG
jgi:hypothetical protein